MAEEREQTGSPPGPVVLVTGGAGFLGRALVAELLRPGNPLGAVEVRCLDTRPFEDPPAGLVALRGDVRSAGVVEAACEGVEVVLHAAAIVDWGATPEHLLWAVNVSGTDNVIAACRARGVRALVLTSSEDAVYPGPPVVDGDETMPYPERFPTSYARTKAQAERAVLAADGSARRTRGPGDSAPLRTAAIRPCGMWGEADPYHVGNLLEMARRGVLVRLGDGTARFQHVYVGNVAHAHLLAARALLRGDEAVFGQAYFVTDAPAANFFEFFEPVVRGVGLRMLPRWAALPRSVAYGLGLAMEASAYCLRPFCRIAPTLTRYSVGHICNDVTWRSDKAARDLGYRPVYSEAEALARTVAHFRSAAGRSA